MKTNKKKSEFLKLVSDEKSDLIAKLQWEEDNEDWLEASAKIAMQILDELEKRNWTQNRFAYELNVNQSYISKIVKGRENFTLETICKLERVLGIDLLNKAHRNLISNDFTKCTNWFEYPKKRLPFQTASTGSTTLIVMKIVNKLEQTKNSISAYDTEYSTEINCNDYECNCQTV